MIDRRETISRWLRAGLEAVDPERLTRDALSDRSGPMTVLAIGKAAPAMCRGAASALGRVEGLCVTSYRDTVPEDVELLVGDHPLPGAASYGAGLRAIEVAARADVALISGGGSAMCEVPGDGLTLGFVTDVYERLLDAGTSITDINLVRAHLSKIKGGGLGPMTTYVLSDVAGAGPEVVSSGPTVPFVADPERALLVLKRVGVMVDETVERVVRSRVTVEGVGPPVRVLADGRSAAKAVALAAIDDGVPARVQRGWIEGDFESNLDRLLFSADRGVTVAAGEPSVPASAAGRGGRNTHAALAAAEIIEGTDLWFAALATDGVDGRSGSAGAIVDGETISRGGDPAPALARFDSADYLRKTGDLIDTGPTGTNVADLWMIWKPEDGPEPILSG